MMHHFCLPVIVMARRGLSGAVAPTTLGSRQPTGASCSFSSWLGAFGRRGQGQQCRLSSADKGNRPNQRRGVMFSHPRRAEVGNAKGRALPSADSASGPYI